MKVTLKTGLIFAGIWIALKLILFTTGISGENIIPSVMLNILCILLAIAIGLYQQKVLDIKNGEAGNALRDIKNGMTAGVPYAFVVSLFLFFYYNNIHPEFNAHQIAEAEMGIQKLLDDPDGLAEVKASNAEFEVMTKEEIYEQLIQGPRSFYSAGSTMTISMLALLLLGTMNSIFVTVVYRKVVFK